MGLFDGLKPKPRQDENQLIAQQIIERRTKENLIEKFTKDFHSIDLDNQEEMYDYMICNVKDIFKTFSSSKELCDGLYIKNFLNAIYDVITQNPEFTFTPEEVFGFNDAAYLYLINCNYSKQTKDEIREAKDKLFTISHIIIPAEYDNLKIFENSFSSDFLNEISCFDRLISFRLHSHILAFALGIPSVAIKWDEKITTKEVHEQKILPAQFMTKASA